MPAKKKIAGLIKLQIQAGAATPAPRSARRWASTA
jgi:ribosomal protein L11